MVDANNVLAVEFVGDARMQTGDLLCGTGGGPRTPPFECKPRACKPRTSRIMFAGETIIKRGVPIR